MPSNWFAVNNGLADAGRFPSLARANEGISAIELAMLLTCGTASAAILAFVKLSLGIPGHSIVLTALPMALGMSLAPRRLAGSIMSASALTTAALLVAGGAGRFGSGAFTSLLLIGPMMDVALRNARGAWRVYASLVLAGVATNLLALVSRAAPKLLGIDIGRPFDSWWLQASFTYTLSGIVAGLFGAVCWFQFNDRSEHGPDA